MSHQHRLRRGLRKHLYSQLLHAQETEITENAIYTKLAQMLKAKDPKNSQVLERIAKEEAKHAEFWRGYTQKVIHPKPMQVFFHTLIAKILGLTFSVKLMEKGEEAAQVNYKQISQEIPKAQKIKQEEDEHETALLNLLDEESLKYVGSMVLGVNDALVELTGALAGLTLALQNTRLIAVIGLITGLAASLSMGASEYLSTKAETQDKNPLKAAVYTGLMYVVTVILLIIPYYLVTNIFLALGMTLTIAILIILCFTFYISVAQDLPFKKRFLEMAGISLGVSLMTFGIGYVVRTFLGVEV
jgi:VIT1/CCC1 family predicted Fe2+/Mn2+ transporter